MTGHRIRLTAGFLSTLPARGATRVLSVPLDLLHISIHAPREGSDLRAQSRRPHAGISIHAPREGSDLDACIAAHANYDFYPRSPRGERRAVGLTPAAFVGFLSTLPARGATDRYHRVGGLTIFLSTLPARGATRFFLASLSSC